MSCLLNENLDISTVLEATNQYKNWVSEASETLLVDGSQVSKIDAAGIQALASLFNSAQNSNVNIELANATPTLEEAIRVLGLQRLIK
ncbi:STAS domain-containing protein [Vibrio mexicanus]|uniref:STAS domain-containing protein n=1 Tax=Vibrio mexicanus TaxID=1004326 RepID=UPI00063C375E|nr:STAS domain-containing protein [Vibrio mexicanus]